MILRSLGAIIAAMALVVLAGCDSPPPPPVPANIFPEATEVRLYLNSNEISVDETGRLNPGSYPAKGIRLTRAEITDIRKATSYGPPPKYGEACCVPRHAFLFYDKNRKYLGSLTVCFSCDCSYLKGAAPPPDEKLEFMWDYVTFERVVKNHGQPVIFDDGV